MESPTIIALRFQIGFSMHRSRIAKTDLQKHWWINRADAHAKRLVELVGF